MHYNQNSADYTKKKSVFFLVSMKQKVITAATSSSSRYLLQLSKYCKYKMAIT